MNFKKINFQLLMEKYNKYAKHIGADEYIVKWVNTTLKNYLEKNESSTEEVEHILDYLVLSKKKVSKMSYKEAKSLADKWMKIQIKKGNNIKESEEDTEVILDFKDGFKIVKLIGENAYKREGYLMSSCVASYYGNNKEIYSLRDNKNMPHCTMEYNQQVKGKGNGDIHPKYIKYIVEFLEYMKMTVGENEMKHLGYINIQKIKKYLHKDTKYFNKIYLPENKKLIGKDGKEFASLDLLDIKPLVKEVNNELKINFDLKTFIDSSINFLFKNKKKIFSGHYNQNASSGDYGQNASSGYCSKNASSGDYSQNASSGDYNQNTSSGDYSKNASSGDYGKNASSGDYSKNASSGDCSKNASSGDYSKNASSGDCNQNASSGDNNQNASSGDYSQNASSGANSKNASSGRYGQNASSGDYSRNASSGDYSQNGMIGKNSISVNAGHKGKVKGKIGCWFALSEWKKVDNNWIPLCVKAFKIDGIKIKEDTWYMLKNGKLTKVKN